MFLMSKVISYIIERSFLFTFRVPKSPSNRLKISNS